jgi:hypothetical protein
MGVEMTETMVGGKEKQKSSIIIEEEINMENQQICIFLSPNLFRRKFQKE